MKMNAYFRASTANPTGQRPWNFAMQGGLGHLRGSRRMGRLGRLGDSSFLPSGSQLSYTATWPASSIVSLIGNPRQVSDAIQNQLKAQFGINILSEYDNASFFTNTGFTLTVQTTRDYGTAADIKSILDSVVGTQVGAPGMIGSGYGSSIAMITASQSINAPLSTLPGNGLTIDNSGGAPSVDPMTWVTQNFTTIALFVGALVLLPPLIKKL